jgi:hypothetical protein
LREAIGDKDAHKYLIHDRDRIFAKRLDDSIRALGLEVLRSPFESPQANALCERVIGTIRRECLDWMIPMSEMHLRSILREWVTHYNRGRPHSALGPGVPDLPRESAQVPKSESRHRLPAGARVLAKSVLGALHHEYSITATPQRLHCRSQKIRLISHAHKSAERVPRARELLRTSFLRSTEVSLMRFVPSTALATPVAAP